VKVLLMAYECSPYRGSEWAVGWGRLLQAARAVETHVVTSEANFAALERAEAEGLLPEGVKFYTPEPDARLREMEKKPVLFAYNYTAYEFIKSTYAHFASRATRGNWTFRTCGDRWAARKIFHHGFSACCHPWRPSKKVREV
jgi:hypothetical protein